MSLPPTSVVPRAGVDATGAGAPKGGDRLGEWKERLRRLAHSGLDPAVRVLAHLGLRPDHLTWAGLVVSGLGALAFFEGEFRVGALLALLAGVCDILDGQLARQIGICSRFGAFLDSTLDRLSESLLLLGITGYYVGHLVGLVADPGLAVIEIQRELEPMVWERVALISVLALIGSFMVSYTRARAEGLGLECKVGWFERPERLTLLILGGLFGVGGVMSAVLIVLAILSFATAFQRMAYVWKSTRGAGQD